MNQKSIYWLCQIFGWTIFSLSEMVNYLTDFVYVENQINQIIGTGIVTSVVGIALTHLFRIYFIQYNWVKLPIPALIARSLIGIFIISVILVIINIPLEDGLINFNSVHIIIKDLVYLVNLSKPVIIWVLIYVFFALSTERQKEAIERIKLESSVKESEVKILRAQLNPHFIFNALNSIRALIIENPKKAQDGVTQLSHILRSSLVADRNKTISLKDELMTVNDYLALEKVRYEDRLQIKLTIQKETLGLAVPPMMLQTLVENGIKHGVQKAKRWGFVEIISKIQNEFLLVIIRNTGNLEQSNPALKNQKYGLENTIKRLSLIFGEEANFRIFQENNFTVRAEIKIPINYKPIENESTNY